MQELMFAGAASGCPKKHSSSFFKSLSPDWLRCYALATKEPLAAVVGAPGTGHHTGRSAMTAPVEQYRREQEALERQRDMKEKAKDFDFISMMIKALGMGNKR